MGVDINYIFIVIKQGNVCGFRNITNVKNNQTCLKKINYKMLQRYIKERRKTFLYNLKHQGDKNCKKSEN